MVTGSIDYEHLTILQPNAFSLYMSGFWQQLWTRVKVPEVAVVQQGTWDHTHAQAGSEIKLIPVTFQFSKFVSPSHYEQGDFSEQVLCIPDYCGMRAAVVGLLRILHLSLLRK